MHACKALLMWLATDDDLEIAITTTTKDKRKSFRQCHSWEEKQ